MPRGIYLHCGEYSWWELQAHQEWEGGRPSWYPLQLWVDQQGEDKPLLWSLSMGEFIQGALLSI